jgi:tmRNA-binding protein
MILMDKVLSKNFKISKNYVIYEKWTCGLQLKGIDVPLIRKSNININHSYIYCKNNELFVVGAYISKDKYKDHFKYRKLIANKHEIRTICTEYIRNNISVLPFQIILRKHLIKIVIVSVKSTPRKLVNTRKDESKIKVLKITRLNTYDY